MHIIFVHCWISYQITNTQDTCSLYFTFVESSHIESILNQVYNRPQGSHQRSRIHTGTLYAMFFPHAVSMRSHIAIMLASLNFG